MHKKIVANVVSRVVLVVCFIMLIPLGWAIHDDPKSIETAAFLETIVCGILMSLLVIWFFRTDKVDFQKINPRDGLAVVGLSWIALSILGAFPLYLSHAVPHYTDALFEIVSGFTTTGASVITNIEALPRGILFWRSLTHWLGGMGIIVLYLALLPALGINAYQLYKAEAPGITVDRIEPRIKETAKALWAVYFLLTIIQTTLLWFGGMPVFDSLCHTFGTVATGGFSTKNASIAAYGPYIQWVIIVFMFLAGVNFILHYLALTGKLDGYIKSEEFRYYLILVLGLLPLFVFLLQTFYQGEELIRASLFQIVAMLTTTGYTTANFDAWPHVLRFMLVVLMFIGGCGGSTGGGMKVARVYLSTKIAIRSIVQATYPNAVMPIKFNKIAMSDKIIMGVMAYFMIFVFLFFVGTATIIVTESCDLVTAFTSSLSALSNIGPGLSGIGPTKNFAWFSDSGKWVLMFLMLAGRLELYSILILFLPSTWRK